MPAVLRGSPTMVASAEPVAAPEPQPRVASRQIPAQEELPAPTPVRTAFAAPVAAPVAVSLPVGRPAPGTPLPPDRPFDLGTIPNAAKPVPVPLPRSALRGGTHQAGLFFAEPEMAATGFRKADPIAQYLTAQNFVPLRQN
jgi:rare lipoprotein A